MNRFPLWFLAIGISGCLGSAATNVGDSDTFPLIRVDGGAIPQTISDSTGNSVKVINGSLTTYSYTASCDYKIDFSNGKSLTGTKACFFGGDVKQITDGAEISLDASEIGGPAGLHYYDFNTNTGKPCTCGRLCAHPGCNILIDTARSARAAPDNGDRLKHYIADLSRGR